MPDPPSDVFAPPTRDVCIAGLDELTPTQRSLLLDYWRRRTDAEWTTMEALAHVREDLVTLDAPSVLIDTAGRAIADEERHSHWCHAMAERVGNETFRAPRLRGSQRLTFPGASESENRLLRPIFAGCLSETIAVCVLKINRDEIQPTMIREAQRVHLADEVNHSRLGWGFLAHAAKNGWLEGSTRHALEHALPMMFRLARDLWGSGDISDDPELAALGYLTRRQIDAGIETAFRDVIVPAFEAHGFGRLED